MSVLLDQFVHSLDESGLMTAEEVDVFLNRLAPEDRPSASEDLAKLLCKCRKLTKYQAQAIYQGKAKGLVLGNYVVLDRIGQGGMGHVYKARHKRMDRVVALKVLPAAVAREPKSKLSHQNIVAAFDADVADSIDFLVMEYVDGENLAEAVGRRGPLAVSETIDYLRQAARGLAYAHGAGVIHRDVKPSNLLLDKSGVVKVLDVGLAHIEEKIGPESTTASGALTRNGQVMGTIDYMAPEQSEDAHHVDQRADIYGLGATLFFLLVGRPVYSGSSLAAKIIAHREAALPSLCAERPDVPDKLDEVFHVMLAKRPDERYSSMAEVISELDVCEASTRETQSETTPTVSDPTVKDTSPNGPAADSCPPMRGDEGDEWLNAELPQLPTQFGISRVRRSVDGDETQAATPRQSIDETEAPSDAAVAIRPPRHFGDYELVEEIARGGMGIVYKARQVSLKRVVALKIMLAGPFAADKDVRRFHAEAEAAAHLQHPNIVSIIEVGQYEDQHYIAMELVNGQNLSQRMRDKQISERESARIIRTLSNAIHHAHENGILHRDLKPSNVLIDRSGHVSITDFGLARQLEADSSLTGTGQILGTPSYMSPEQAEGLQQDLTCSTDVYSLGAILYEMLAGVPPFQGETRLAIVSKVQTDDPDPPRRLNPTLKADIEAICLKCLQKQPRKRYANAKELANDLGRFLDNKPVHARHPNLWERWLKYAGRNAEIASMLGMSTAMTVVGLFATAFALKFALFPLPVLAFGALIGAFVGLLSGAMRGIVGFLNGGFYGLVLSFSLGLTTVPYLWFVRQAQSFDLVVALFDFVVAGVPVGVCGGLLGGSVGRHIAGDRPALNGKPGFKLKIAKSADETVVNLGDTVTFRIEIRNEGRLASPELLVEDFLPRGLRYESEGDSIVHDLESVAPGRSVEISLDLRATKKGRQTNRVAICDDKNKKVHVRAKTSINVVAGAPPTKPANVVQHLQEWQSPAPKLQRSETQTESNSTSSNEEDRSIPSVANTITEATEDNDGDSHSLDEPSSSPEQS